MTHLDNIQRRRNFGAHSSIWYIFVKLSKLYKAQASVAKTSQKDWGRRHFKKIALYTQQSWCTYELTEIVTALMRPIKFKPENLRMEKRSEHKILTLTKMQNFAKLNCKMVLQLTHAKKVKTNFL